MENVTVIAAMGARVAGPARLRLTKAQWERRAALLGPCNKKRGGIVELDGGQVLNFKHRESFGFDAPGRLNKALFEYDAPDDAEAEAKAKEEADAKAKAKEEADAKAKAKEEADAKAKAEDDESAALSGASQAKPLPGNAPALKGGR
ncbi:hypothetical protein EMVG_00009 [Emiliania huxleyi virus PS401]|nr:hypothetical protein EMVG_00009 [Emiliania huxleyi virus PS401]